MHTNIKALYNFKFQFVKKIYKYDLNIILILNKKTVRKNNIKILETV